MLTTCGGMHDFVKLLDFGLVKPQNADRNMTMAGSLTGTPLYLSPEEIQHEELDARNDLYAVGSVGYYLLTGTPVFDGKNIVGICNKHLQTEPETPSSRLGRPIDKGLEQLILRCLSKQPNDRPATAELIETELQQCQAIQTWNRNAARSWWAENLSDSNLNDTGPVEENLSETVIATTSESVEPFQSNSD